MIWPFFPTARKECGRRPPQSWQNVARLGLITTKGKSKILKINHDKTPSITLEGGQLSTSWTITGNPRSCRWTQRSGSSNPWWSLLYHIGAETWTVIVMWRIQAFINTWTRQILLIYLKPWIHSSELVSGQWSSKGTGDGLSITSHKAYPLLESTREKERRETKKHLDAEVKRSAASWRNRSWAMIYGKHLFLAEVQTWVVGASKFLHPALIFVDRRAVHIDACVGLSALLTTITDGLDDRTTINPQSDLSVSTPVLRCCHVYPVRLQIPHDHEGVNGFCGLLVWTSVILQRDVFRVGNWKLKKKKGRKKWRFHRKKLFGILAGGANVI